MNDPMNPAAEVQPARLGAGAKAVMVCGGAVVTLALTALSSVLPQIEAALAHGPADKLLVKMLVSIIGLSMLIGAPLGGYLIDRIGMKRVLLVASLVYGVAGTAGFYLNSLPPLIASRLVMGSAGAAIATCSMTLINTRLAGNERARWMGMHVSVYMATGILVFPAAGYLGEFGWRWPFALYAIGFLLAAVVALGIHPAMHAPRARAVPVASAGAVGWFPIRFGVLAFIIGCMTYSTIIYAPFVIRDAGVTSPTQISLVMMGGTIGAAGLASTYSLVQRHLAMLPLFACSFALLALGSALTALAPHILGIAIGLTVYSFGLAWLVPNLMTSAAQRIDLAYQGRAVGLLKACQYIASPAAALLLEPVSQRFGPSGAILALTALATGTLALIGYRTLFGHTRAGLAYVPGR